MSKMSKILWNLLFEEVLDEDQQYASLKFQLDKIQGGKSKKILLIGSVLAGIIIAFFMVWHNNLTSENTLLINVGFGAIIGVIIGITVFFIGIIALEGKEADIKIQLLKYEADVIKDQIEEDIFENSIKLSYKYLDQYYSQTRAQAQKGFFTTVCVSVFGALLIGVGVIMMFIGKVEPSYITCASGVITEFIAAIFFYLYNKTITSMSKYHNKLVLSHNISVALKVADSLPDEDKVKAKNLIISELLKDINVYLIRNDSENNGERYDSKEFSNKDV